MSLFNENMLIRERSMGEEKSGDGAITVSKTAAFAVRERCGSGQPGEVQRTGSVG